MAISLVLDLYQKLFIMLILKIKQSMVSLHMQSKRWSPLWQTVYLIFILKTENGNYEGGASQVLVLLSNYYSNKKLFDENRDGYGNILILKDASIISKSSIIPDLLKGDIVENNNIEYIKVCNIKISSDVELESDVDGDKSDKLPVDIKILGNHIEVFSGMKE